MLDHYNDEPGTVDYLDFLHSIRRLVQDGKLLQSNYGLFWVEPILFKEIWEKPATPTFNRRGQSQQNGNPLLPPSRSRKGAHNAFTIEQIQPTRVTLQTDLWGKVA